MCEHTHHGHDKGQHDCGCGGIGRGNRLIVPAILILLAESESHGYKLIEKIPPLEGTARPADPGGVYRILRSLEEEGFVESRWETEESGPARRIYSITGDGFDLLKEWVEVIKKRREALGGLIAKYEAIDTR